MRRHWKPGLIRPLMKIYKSYRIIELVQMPPGIYSSINFALKFVD